MIYCKVAFLDNSCIFYSQTVSISVHLSYKVSMRENQRNI